MKSLFSQPLPNSTQLCLSQVSSPSFRELALGFLALQVQHGYACLSMINLCAFSLAWFFLFIYQQANLVFSR
jgi:hypothetical protein